MFVRLVSCCAVPLSCGIFLSVLRRLGSLVFPLLVAKVHTPPIECKLYLSKYIRKTYIIIYRSRYGSKMCQYATLSTASPPVRTALRRTNNFYPSLGKGIFLPKSPRNLSHGSRSFPSLSKKTAPRGQRSVYLGGPSRGIAVSALRDVSQRREG